MNHKKSSKREKNKEATRPTEKNGNNKFFPISNYFKFK